MQEISYIFEVKGAAIEASASDNDTPISAVFNAPQSFAPSPHIPQVGLCGRFCKDWRSYAFSSGFILANIYVFNNIY
jgi:hypothetical protein